MEKINYKVVDNFLPEKEFKTLRDRIMSQDFNWFCIEGVSYHSAKDGVYFIHTFFDEFQRTSNFFNLIRPILDKIKVKALIRAKANLYLKTPTLIRHGLHKDYKWGEAPGLIFSINDCDGETYLKDKVRVVSKANRALFFDAGEDHASTSCTDQDRRVNINFNYF